MIIEKDQLLSDEKSVAEIMNNYFINISQGLDLKPPPSFETANSHNIMYSFEDHISVQKIRENKTDNNEFHFRPISNEELKKVILDLDCNKSNLNGSIPANILKDTCDIYIPYLTVIINDSFEKGCFPDVLKLAEVTPVFKKKDPLDKENYRSVSVLSHVSKVFEKIVYEQINSYMEPRFSHLLCGFRKNHNTQHSLLKMLEKWKLFLDKGYNIGVIYLSLKRLIRLIMNYF